MKSDKNRIVSAVGYASLFLFLFAVGGLFATAQTSNINDDLQPAKTAAKSKTPRSKINKPTRTATKKINSQSGYRRPPTAAPAKTVAAQTPSEVIARYMNFQQSGSVGVTDWENVIRQTNAVLQSNPNDATAKAQLAIAQGQTAFMRGDYSNALVQFNAAEQLLPNSSLPSYGIGRVYLNTRQPGEAENAFERAIKINKTFALAYKGLGDALSAQGKSKKAQEYYQQAAHIGVTNNSSNSAAGRTMMPQNNQNRAFGNQQKSPPPVAAPESAYDRELRAARNLTAQKKWNQSLGKLQPLAAANPSADLYILIGDNYFGMRAWLSAQQAYRKASEINPNSANAVYKSALVLYETNEFQAAGEAFEKSLILDQTGTTINRAQARKMADKARDKARAAGKDKKKLFGLLN